jgi:DNA-binding CsgD family transcriptional regulator
VRLEWHEPSVSQFHGDLIEALVEVGERAEAAEVLDRLIADAECTATPWPVPIAERGRGLLEPDDEVAVAHFARALALHEGVEDPFERARTELLLADRLRQAGRRDDGRDAVRTALETFELLGARPWADRARRVMTRSGVRVDEDDDTPTPETPQAPPDLTGQEWRIVQLVTAGMTNREVAGALFLSPKTIEHVLTGIYKKLGVRSRTQLAKKMASSS